MVAATMAMFEMGLSLTAQQGKLAPPPDSYLGGSQEQRDDRLWLQLLNVLNDSEVLNDQEALNKMPLDLYGQDLCDQLLCRINEREASRCEAKEDDNKSEASPDAEQSANNDQNQTSESMEGSESSVDNSQAEELPVSLYIKGYESLADFSHAPYDAGGSDHPFGSACVFNKGEHRVLIVPSVGQPDMPYGLFSCTTKSDPLCAFELIGDSDD